MQLAAREVDLPEVRGRVDDRPRDAPALEIAAMAERAQIASRHREATIEALITHILGARNRVIARIAVQDAPELEVAPPRARAEEAVVAALVPSDVRATAPLTAIVGACEPVVAVLVAAALGALVPLGILAATLVRLDLPVEQIMTSPAITVEPATTIDETLGLMTRRRFRHFPVVESGALIGFISIGDLVKHKIDEVQHEAEALRNYIQAV